MYTIKLKIDTTHERTEIQLWVKSISAKICRWKNNSCQVICYPIFMKFSALKAEIYWQHFVKFLQLSPLEQERNVMFRHFVFLSSACCSRSANIFPFHQLYIYIHNQEEMWTSHETFSPVSKWLQMKFKQILVF
jgi:hypothetical protein